MSKSNKSKANRAKANKSKPKKDLTSILKSCGLLDSAEKVGDDMYRMSWGSATVVCVARASAIVAIAPMFDSLPKASKLDGFYKKLLTLNAEMGGTASFAIQDDNSVVLQCGRGMEGLDPEELKLLLNTVGKFADDYDDILDEEYYK